MANQGIIIPWQGWTLVKLLGHGSFGSVYEIERRTEGRHEAAVMMIVPVTPDRLYDMYGSSYDEETARKMCGKEQIIRRMESDIMASLKNDPDIVRCDDYRIVKHPDGAGFNVYIMMEPLTKTGAMSGESALRLSSDVFRSLTARDEHHISRNDVKSQNSLIDKNGSDPVNSGKNYQKPSAGSSKPSSRNIIIAAVVALLFCALAAIILFRQEPVPPPEPEDSQTEDSSQAEDTSGATSPETADIDSQMKAELELFLQDLAYCYQSREGSGGAKQYFFTSSDDFGVLQAIMYDLMLSDPDTYNAICPMDIGYRQVSTSDGMDPKGLAADHSLSYMEANADAVNWIAKNVFNVYDEDLQNELNFSSGLTQNALFFAPLYLSDGKYYMIPESGGGMGVQIRIEEIYLDDGMGDNSGQSYYVRYTPGTMMPDGSTDWDAERLAVLDYKTSNGKGYWSLYKDISAD